YKEIKFNREEIPCPLCNSSSFNVLYKPSKEINDPKQLYGAASGITGAQTIVKCRDCSLIYENPRLPIEAIIYGYKSADNAGHDSQHQMRRASFLKALKKLKKHLPPQGARVLDVGTAGGAFLEAAEDFGYQAVGIEPSDYLVEAGKKKGLNIYGGTLQDNPIKGEKFDMVCFWDVLEHIADPVETILLAKEMLKPDGILLINYPDIGTWQAKLAGKRFWWLLSVHLVHFSRKTIVELANRTGLEVFKFDPYWQTLEFGYLVHIADHLNVPLAGLVKKALPSFIGKIPIPYYASQTTALLRIKKQ
ncbi:MAG: class I SAM-dependent methyltransferase, partial [Candidatus Dadabacteria bacterium]